MQSGQESLGILRDEPDRADVLGVRELLTSADNYRVSSLLYQKVSARFSYLKDFGYIYL
jgi:hypothetical protein